MPDLQPIINAVAQQITGCAGGSPLRRFWSYKFFLGVLTALADLAVAYGVHPEKIAPVMTAITTIGGLLIASTAHEDATKAKAQGNASTAAAAIVTATTPAPPQAPTLSLPQIPADPPPASPVSFFRPVVIPPKGQQP